MRGEAWNGVRNHQAAGFLRAMRRGDQAFVYHTGQERRVVGIAEVVDESFPDPDDPSGRFVAVTVRAREALAQPVTLAAIKAVPALAACPLVRQSRLSVMPLTPAEWRQVRALAAA